MSRSLRYPLNLILLLAVSCGDHRSSTSTTDTASSASSTPTQTAPPDTIPSKAAAQQADKTDNPPGVPWHLDYTTDLNNDGVMDTIHIASSGSSRTSFDTVSIALAHFDRQIFLTTEPWSTVDTQFLHHNKNAIQTDKFFLGKNKIQSVLLLFGDDDESGRLDFGIVNIEDNKARMVLRQNERQIDIDIPISLTDLNGDGRLDLLYRQSFEFNGQPDTLGGMIGTYSPYFIYSIDDKCELNQPLTRRYNDSLYVFAGYEYSEHIDVFYPNDGSKPRLLGKER